MAGDIEEPFRINFQGDFVISDSISFGRYESESLSWERRSSFSHNRYLEEVEKCSKPGSVNEKKAYFEAHFKKRGGLLCQNSPESHNGFVYQTIENGASEKVDQGSDFENANKENHNDHFDDSSASPENQGGHETPEIEILNPEVLFTNFKFGSAFSSTGSSMDDALHDFSPEIKEQSNSENKLPTFVGDSPEIKIKQNINNTALSEDILPESMNSCPRAELVKRAGKSGSGSQPTLSVKITSKRETKASNSQVNIHQNRRSNTVDAFKSPEKVSNKSKGEPPQIICTGGHSSKTTTLKTHAVHSTSKIVDSKVIKGKANLDSRSSEKGRKFRESYSSQLKLESRSYLKTRHNQTVNSALKDTGKNASACNFRSIESVERRKQFRLKLEDKVHMKEADRFKSQARTQGKAEAETKKLQKNIDNKSKAISSSYGAVKPESDGKKVVVRSTKVRNTLRKSTAVGLSSHLASRKDTDSSATEALDTSKKMQKCKVSESCGLSKGLTMEGKQKAGAQRSTNLMGRKKIKGVSVSGIDRLTVSVTS